MVFTFEIIYRPTCWKWDRLAIKVSKYKFISVRRQEHTENSNNNNNNIGSNSNQVGGTASTVSAFDKFKPPVDLGIKEKFHIKAMNYMSHNSKSSSLSEKTFNNNSYFADNNNASNIDLMNKSNLSNLNITANNGDRGNSNLTSTRDVDYNIASDITTHRDKDSFSDFNAPRQMEKIEDNKKIDNHV